MDANSLLMIAMRTGKSGMRRLFDSRARVREESGANSIEVAFIAMFIFVLIAGIVDLGGAYQHLIIVTNSSREGARLYARLPCTSTNRAALKTAVIGAARGEGANSNVLLPASSVTLAPDPSSACPAAGSTVRVTVQINYETLLGQFWGATTFPIRAQTSMMFYGVD